MSQGVIGDRFAAAALASARFVSVRDGNKMCVDHDTRFDDPDAVPGRNYGIYCDEDDQLLILDVDVHRGGDEDHARRALVALADLDFTLRVRSPHADEDIGGHRIYKLAGDETPAELFERVFGRKNPVPSWGEVVSKNKYVVGPGSQLNGCTKDWCDTCAEPDGGRYVIDEDREIATVEPEEVVDALAADPDLTRTDATAGGDADLSEYEGDGADGGDADREYGDLDRSEVEDLLDALPGDQHFDDWITTGYAVYDWDDGVTGKEVFTEWSRTNSKWEREESQEQIDYIWTNGESGDGAGNASVGTLVHKAREHGYDGTLGGTPPSPEDVDPDVVDWSLVRELYEAPHGTTPDKYARKAATDLLLRENEYATPTDTEELYEYHRPSGVYEPGGEPSVKSELRENLGAHCSNSEINEIVAAVKERTYIEREEFNGGEDERLLCVENGVLDLETRERREHDPEYYFTRTIPVEYDPDATAPAVESFLNEITEREADKRTMLEMVGSALWPEYLHGKFMILFGEGGNGKSVFYHAVKRLLGDENVTGWDLQDLGDNRFATAALVGKYANIGGDMDSVKIKHTGVLKKLTGGDQMMVEDKNESAHEFVNSATLMFGANRPPVIDEASRAIKRRLVPVRLPYEFSHDADEVEGSEYTKPARDEDELKDALTDEDELAGFLNMALDGLDRLRENGDVSLPESQEERLEYYEQFSDPIKEFAVRCLENEEDQRVEKDSVYSAYKEFCADRDYTNRQKSTFFRQLARTTFDVNTVRAGSDGQRTQMLDSATFSEVGRQYAPDYADETGDGATDDSTRIDDAPALGDLNAGFTDLTVTVAERLDPPEWMAGKGHLVDDAGNIIPYECEGTDPLAENAEGDTVMLENAKIAMREAGPTAVLSGVTNATTATTPNTDSDQSGLDAATDGGGATAANSTADPQSRRERFKRAYKRAEDDDAEFVEYADLYRELTEWYDEEGAEHLIETAKSETNPPWIIAVATRTFRRGTIFE